MFMCEIYIILSIIQNFCHLELSLHNNNKFGPRPLALEENGRNHDINLIAKDKK